MSELSLQVANAMAVARVDGMRDAAKLVRWESKKAHDMIMHYIGESKIRFWLCPNGCTASSKRGRVKWEDDIATCCECGEHSK